jgi:hypothetical protein
MPRIEGAARVLAVLLGVSCYEVTTPASLRVVVRGVPFACAHL